MSTHELGSESLAQLPERRPPGLRVAAGLNRADLEVCAPFPEAAVSIGSCSEELPRRAGGSRLRLICL
jgi:hypothetical protein